jgi:hypothetical protein
MQCGPGDLLPVQTGDAGVLEEVGRRQVRGAMQTFYRLSDHAVRGGRRCVPAR